MGKISFIYFLLMCFLLLGSKIRSIILYKMNFFDVQIQHQTDSISIVTYRQVMLYEINKFD